MMLKRSKKNCTAEFWQGRLISLPKNQSTMNRVPIDEMYMLYSLYGFRDLTEEEANRFSVILFEYQPHPELFMARMQFEYENSKGVKAELWYELAGKRSEDHFYEHVVCQGIAEEIEFPDFRKAIDFCEQQEE